MDLNGLKWKWITIEVQGKNLVVRGFKQIARVDYHEMFNRVARFDSIRIILSKDYHSLEQNILTTTWRQDFSSRRTRWGHLHAASEGMEMTIFAS